MDHIAIHLTTMESALLSTPYTSYTAFVCVCKLLLCWPLVFSWSWLLRIIDWLFSFYVLVSVFNSFGILSITKQKTWLRRPLLDESSRAVSFNPIHDWREDTYWHRDKPYSGGHLTQLILILEWRRWAQQDKTRQDKTAQDKTGWFKKNTPSFTSSLHCIVLWEEQKSIAEGLVWDDSPQRRQSQSHSSLNLCVCVCVCVCVCGLS